MKTAYNSGKNEQAQRVDEQEEDPIVELPNTVAKPWTVVIESKNAAVASRAVTGPHWSDYLTGGARFDLCDVALVDEEPLVSFLIEVIDPVKFGVCHCCEVLP